MRYTRVCRSDMILFTVFCVLVCLGAGHQCSVGRASWGPDQPLLLVLEGDGGE